MFSIPNLRLQPLQQVLYSSLVGSIIVRNCTIGEVQYMDTSEEVIAGNVPCAICRRQFSRYTCPRCNIPYCSLTCFRSSNHAGCSETFYKKELEIDIKTTPSKTAEERRRMMELLKRFEEDSLEESEFLAGDEEDDFTERFKSLDIGHASYDQIWSTLTSEERDKFLKALNDPTSELAQQLLMSEELERQKIEPWWESPDQEAEEAELVSKQHPAMAKTYGTKPKIIDIPGSVLAASTKSLNQGPSLLYNIIAVLMAYAYVTRFFATSPLSKLDKSDLDHEEARHNISRLVPFLVDRKSTTVLPNLSALVTDLWSRFEPGTMTSMFFSMVLNDASKLLRPSAITVLPPSNDASSSTFVTSTYEFHPSANALLVLSDLVSFFAPSPSSKSRQTTAHIIHKLTFYAARIISTPTGVLSMIADEVMLRAEVIRREGAADEATAVKKGPARPIELSEAEKTAALTRVEELHPREGGKDGRSRRVVIEELT